MTETSLTCKGICVEQRFTSKFAVRVVNIWQTIGRQLATIWPENHYNYTFFGAQLAALQRALRCVQSHRSTSRASWRRPLLRTIFVPCSERTRYKLFTNRSSAVSEAILHPNKHFQHFRDLLIPHSSRELNVQFFLCSVFLTILLTSTFIVKM